MKGNKKQKKMVSKSRNSSSSSESEYEWTSLKGEEASQQQCTDSDRTWIAGVNSVESFVDNFTTCRQKKNTTKTEKSIKAVELNPYWNDGGSGVPDCESSCANLNEKSTLTEGNEAWLYKSYKRCLEQAKEKNASVRQLLLERWNEATVDDMLNKFDFQRNSTIRHDRSRFPSIKENKPSTRPRWRKVTPHVPKSSASKSPDRSASPRTASRSSPEAPMSSTSCTEPNILMEEREVTDEDINEMAAKVLRAELTSNAAKVEKLKTNLEKLREAKRRGIKVRLRVTRKPSGTGKSHADQHTKPTVVPLTRLNDEGLEMPVHISNLPLASNSMKKSKKFESLDSTGRRKAYFPEDSTPKSLNELMREEQFRSAHDMEYEFTKMAARSGRNVDDEYADAFVSKRSHAERDAVRLKQDAIAAYKRRTYAESVCSVCLERVPKHLVISVGEKAFLSLPEHVSMVPGHCFITPYEHIGSLTRTDECTLREIALFKRQLVGMFHQQLKGSGCVFIETATRPESARSHARVECIPVASDIAESVPGYFKKALAEIGSEWDQNRRVIKLTRPGFGAYGAVPPKFSYFAVEFGFDNGGLARILEDERDISFYFGREVMADLLDKETQYWRKPKPERFEQLRSKVVQFENWWQPFNKWCDRDPRNSGAATISAQDMSIPEGPEIPPELC